MNNKKRTFITIVCSILLIMPSFLGVPLADGNLVLVPTPDSGQINDEISTITDLNDDNINTIITTELLLQADSDESDLSDSDEIQEHAIRVDNGNDDNNNSSIPTEHSGNAESDQSSPSNVVTETALISQEQFPVENASEPTPSWSLIPGYSGIGNGTDSIWSLADPETLPIDDVDSTIVNDALLPDDVNLTTAEDALLNILLNATDTEKEVEKLDPLNGTLGIVSTNETTLTPTPDLTGVITFNIEAIGSEFGSDIANGVYDDSPTVVNAGQPIFGTLTIDQNNTTTSTANLTFNTSDSSQHTISDGDGGANTETVLSPADDMNYPPIETDDIGSTIAENPQIAVDLLANDFDTSIDSLVDSSLIQGVFETVADNHDENTAFTSESITIEGSDLSSTDLVDIIVSNTKSGSSGHDDNNSNYSSSDENHDDGQCSNNSGQDHGQDKHKHKDKDKHRDGGRSNGEARDEEHHADSESTHDNDTGVSHNNSDHQNREGSDDDRDHHDHEDEGENNHNHDE